jgi:hypothetical protein
VIWTQISDGVYSCGFYRARRNIKSWELWWNHPQNFRLLARAPYFEDIKRAAEQHRAKHPV